MSKTLYIYASDTGAVEKCIQFLKNKIEGESTTYNLQKPYGEVPSPDDYDKVIIGASIHAGKMQKKIDVYCSTYESVLKTRKLGLFLCTMTPPEKAIPLLEKVYLESLHKAATATGLFGGAVYFDEMNFLSRFIMKLITKKSKDFENFDEKRMADFAESFN